MTDLRQALDEISAIRAQVARGTEFRGYGPVSIAFSGVLALAVAAIQMHWLRGSLRDPAEFLTVWIATAAVSVILAAIETIDRARRVHSGLAGDMINAAVEQFLPAIIVGIALTAVLIHSAAQDVWMLPGLWELLFGLGVFSSCRFLPRQMLFVGAWYVGCGLVCLMFASVSRTLTPWEMGVPFGIGQVLVAVVLFYGFEDPGEENQ